MFDLFVVMPSLPHQNVFDSVHSTKVLKIHQENQQLVCETMLCQQRISMLRIKSLRLPDVNLCCKTTKFPLETCLFLKTADGGDYTER